MPKNAVDAQNSEAQLGRIAELNTIWERVLHIGTCLTYPRNAIIPHLEQEGFYYLRKGSVLISYCSPLGTERLTLFVQPGCIFNEARTVSLFKPDVLFRCHNEVEVWRFPRSLLEDMHFIRENPDLIANIMHSMGVKMLIHYTFLAEMGVGSPQTLLARFVFSLVRKNGGNLCFSSSLTQQTVANLLGMHRTTLARAIQQLRRQGILTKFTSKDVVVGDLKKLEALAKS